MGRALSVLSEFVLAQLLIGGALLIPYRPRVHAGHRVRHTLAGRTHDLAAMSGRFNPVSPVPTASPSTISAPAVPAYSPMWSWQDFREVGVCHRAPVMLRHG